MCRRHLFLTATRCAIFRSDKSPYSACILTIFYRYHRKRTIYTNITPTESNSTPEESPTNKRSLSQLVWIHENTIILFTNQTKPSFWIQLQSNLEYCLAYHIWYTTYIILLPLYHIPSVCQINSQLRIYFSFKWNRCWNLTIKFSIYYKIMIKVTIFDQYVKCHILKDQFMLFPYLVLKVVWSTNSKMLHSNH